MSGYFYHESLHRSEEAMKKMSTVRITICGAGSLGANIAENLGRAGILNIAVIDMDRVEERNLSTQPYAKADIGSKKARVLANNLYRACGVRGEALDVELDSNNSSKLLRNADIVIDTFDNSKSRAVVQETCANLLTRCLHAGMASRYSEVVWDPGYRVPSAANDDVCDYALARNLAVITAAIAAETCIKFVTEDVMENYTFTLGDMKISKEQI